MTIDNKIATKTQKRLILYRLYQQRTLYDLLFAYSVSEDLMRGNKVLQLFFFNFDGASARPSSSIFSVLSGQSLRFCFRILQFGLSCSPSLLYRKEMISLLIEYLIIQSSVSATMMHHEVSSIFF